MRAILCRELLENLKSLRFIILVAMSILMFSANGFIFARRHSIKTASYQTRIIQSPSMPAHANVNEDVFLVNKNRIFDTNGGPNYPRPSTISTELYVPPNPLLFIAEGGEKYWPYGYTVRPGGVIEKLHTNPRNYKLPDIPEPDWIFIVSIAFSLYIILFGHNLISGEKQQGTLTLVLSNPLSRNKLLFPKYCSLMITIMIPVSIGVLISYIIFSLFSPEIITWDNILRIILMYFASFLFLSLFVFLCLIITSLIWQSSIGLLLLLLIWVIFVFEPYAAFLIAEQISNVPDETELTNRIDTEIVNFLTANTNEYLNSTSPDFKGYFDSEEKAKKALYLTMNKTQKNIQHIYDANENSLFRYLFTVRNISLISPVGILQDIAKNIAGSGVMAIRNFFSDVQVFSGRYDEFIQQKLGEIIITTRDAQAAYYLANSNDNGKKVLQANVPQEYDGDKRDFPSFKESGLSVAHILNNISFDIIGLLLWNIVLAITACAVFSRADVR
ncbi:MAG: ABC transporter permease subunit [Candidatus Latescibacteria bacterium]|nr:ABC transporter permease subunit [Candidatus Latescibacterota bacterium]